MMPDPSDDGISKLSTGESSGATPGSGDPTPRGGASTRIESGTGLGDTPSGGVPEVDWEAFVRNYRTPGFIPGYDIVNKLGSGAFGEVYKAKKASIGKFYAIKFLRVTDEHARSTILRELTALQHFAQIDHPNLVSVEDRGEVCGIPYIVMGYAGDETLKKLLERGPIGVSRAREIFLQVLEGVHALHERSIVHFDLKPANIFLKGDTVRIGDYGLSKLTTDSRNSLSFGRGTPYYTAPEMLQRRGDYRSDIYSLGIILFEMLTGTVPFKGDTEWEVMRKHESERPSIPSAIGSPFRETIERCLSKDPKSRYKNVKEIKLLLTAAAAGSGNPVPHLAPLAAAASAGTAFERVGRAAGRLAARARNLRVTLDHARRSIERILAKVRERSGEIFRAAEAGYRAQETEIRNGPKAHGTDGAPRKEAVSAPKAKSRLVTSDVKSDGADVREMRREVPGPPPLKGRRGPAQLLLACLAGIGWLVFLPIKGTFILMWKGLSAFSRATAHIFSSLLRFAVVLVVCAALCGLIHLILVSVL